jgi:Flp pilus assembly protein TadG
MSSRLSSERGAILIQVAVASIVLIAFSMFVVDYGVMWVSRNEAQNAADGGALAGAVALAYDDFADRTDNGPAKQAARQFALKNKVFGEAPDVLISSDVTFWADRSPERRFPDQCKDETCIRVDVYRNQARGNPLPMMFGQLVRLTDQGVRASAIARAAFGSATDCLKPWAVIDRWEERWADGAPAVDPYSASSNFEKYLTMGPDAGYPDPDITTPDYYEAPSAEYVDGAIDWDTYNPGTGFHPFNPDRTRSPDYGMQLVLKVGGSNDFEFGSGWFMALALEDSTGGKDYLNNIKNCVGTIYQIGDELEINTEPGEKVGPTAQAVLTDLDSLVNQDPGAYWDVDTMSVKGSCCGTSPRIVAIPMVNPDLVAEANRGGRTTVPIANIAGFFVEGMTSGSGPQSVIGRLVSLPGLVTTGGGGPTPSSFLVNISLIR